MNRILFNLRISKKIILMLLHISIGAACIFAIDVRITPPVFDGVNAEIFNSELDRIFSDLRSEILDQVGGIDAFPKKLIGAFANSSVFSSAGATQRSYLGYDSFAFTLGAMAGLQLPTDPFSVVNQLDNLLDKIENENDLKLGVDPQILNVQFGFNTSKFLLENLYLGLKFGYMKLNPLPEYSFQTVSAGILGNYQLIKRQGFAGGLLLWRGINIGTGFIFQNSSLNIDLPLDTYNEYIGTEYFLVSMGITPKLFMDFTTKTFTIPLELMTSVRLLQFLNIPFGFGVDFAFGGSDLNIGMDVDVDFVELPPGLSLRSSAEISLSAGGKAGPSIVNPKLMTGIGLSIGPVILEIPLTYFFLDNGFNLGVTLGFSL
ncbi:MAG: hypothetical protein LBH43_09880 [Treponema sp.]|jgi:hypothetical protein|nr:hypothetical protein [Treponema sp.]